MPTRRILRMSSFDFAYAAGLPFFLNFLLGTVAYGLGLSFARCLVDRKRFCRATLPGHVAELLGEKSLVQWSRSGGR